MASLKVTVKTTLSTSVGSAWPAACSTVTVGAIASATSMFTVAVALVSAPPLAVPSPSTNTKSTVRALVAGLVVEKVKLRSTASTAAWSAFAV